LTFLKVQLFKKIRFLFENFENAKKRTKTADKTQKPKKE
jgi:hypothetical protein